MRPGLGWLCSLTTLLAIGLVLAVPARGESPLQGFSTTAALGDDVPLPEDEAFVVEAIALDPGKALVRFTMPQGYYLYRDRARFLLEGEDQAKIEAEWPAAVAHHDEHFGAVAVYYGQIEVPLQIAGRTDTSAPARLIVRMQGCKENSVCYPPMQRRLEL